MREECDYRGRNFWLPLEEYIELARNKYNFAFWQLQWAFSFKIFKRDLEHAWCVAIAKHVPHYGPLSYFLIFREHTTSTTLGCAVHAVLLVEPFVTITVPWQKKKYEWFGWFMVFNTTFNNISIKKKFDWKI